MTQPEQPETISKDQESGQGGGETSQNNDPGRGIEYRIGDTPE